MLTIQDCLDYCDLDDEEVNLVAHHEHLPYPSAVQLACCLVQSTEGTRTLRFILEDCVCEAKAGGSRKAAATARHALQHFTASHPA
jgi:hypothetical protein